MGAATFEHYVDMPSGPGALKPLRFEIALESCSRVNGTCLAIGSG